jgi:hypothetical protein
MFIGWMASPGEERPGEGTMLKPLHKFVCRIGS